MPHIADLLKRVNRVEIALALWIGTVVAADKIGEHRAYKAAAEKMAEAAIAREQMEQSDNVKERIENDARRHTDARNRAGGSGASK